MAGTLPVRLIKENIEAQLRLSQQIFNAIDSLADLATRSNQGTELREELTKVMRSLLTVGETLSKNADETGKKVLDVVGAE